jgi:hypothetical protein
MVATASGIVTRTEATATHTVRNIGANDSDSDRRFDPFRSRDVLPVRPHLSIGRTGSRHQKG